MSLVKSSTTPKSSNSREMNPSVQPFYSDQSPRQQHPMFAQRPSRPTRPMPMPTQPALVSKARLNPSATRFEPNITQPSYPTERLEMYQQAAPGTQLSFPPPQHINGPVAPNHNMEALIQDMRRTCPALCQSIRQDFDLNAIFHPALITLHGETFLRLAASQIAMQNQVAEMLDMRNTLSQKQKLLDINTASAKDLQAKLVTQQSELSEIRRLLEQQSQSLTSSDVIGTATGRQPRSRQRNVPSRDVTVSPTTSASTSTAIDSSVQRFYSRSTSLPPLKQSLRSDNVDKYKEKYGYGHAETQGPAFQLDRAEERISGGNQEQSSNQSNSEPPVASTATVFEPVSTSARPVVSVGAKKQASIILRKENTQEAEVAETVHATVTSESTNTDDNLKEKSREPADQNVEDKVKSSGIEQPQKENVETPSTPLKVRPAGVAREKSSTTSPNKPVSYAAAVRTTPTKAVHSIDPPAKPLSPAVQNSPGPDLGFKLEPLPKPTVQQVQSQQHQLQTLNDNSNKQDVPFNFEEWKQGKIADGTWEDRPRRSPGHLLHQRPFQSGYRGRGGRPQQYNNENFRPRPMNQAEYKRQWLAWKQNLVNQGKWNPTHPFREAWKNE